MVPVPSEISAGCGLGLKINVEDFDKIKAGVWEEDIYILLKSKAIKESSGNGKRNDLF